MRAHLRSRSGAVQFEELESRQLLSATPQLLADINTHTSSNPKNFVEFQDRLFYTATDDAHGHELWTSDGTPAGTHLVKDIAPGSLDATPSSLVVSGDYLYFSAFDGVSGYELWRTDGTGPGTQRVLDVRAGEFSGLGVNAEMVDIGGTLFFVADDGLAGEALWKTTGSAATTELVKDLTAARYGQIEELTVVGSTLFFVGVDDSHGSELWRSDGTADGTVLVKDIQPGSPSASPAMLTTADGKLFFRASDGDRMHQLWQSDGSAEGTTRVTAAESYSLSSTMSLTSFNDRVYFSVSKASGQTELWSSDGTNLGTGQFGELAMNGEAFWPEDFFAAGDLLYFTGTRGGRSELWKTDGSESNTQRLATLEQNGLGLSAQRMTAFQGNLYFVTMNGTSAVDLWRSDGTVFGTAPWRGQIASAGNAGAVNLGVAGDQLFFGSDAGGNGVELWRTTGSFAGTQLVKDVALYATDSSSSRSFVTAGSYVYFTAYDGTGIQLFSTEGPEGRTIRLTTSAYDKQSADVEQLVPLGDQLYFVARDIHGQQYLGVTSGTPQTTKQLPWPFAGDEVTISGLAQVGASVMFLVQDATLGTLLCRANGQGIEVVQTLGPSWRVIGRPEFGVSQGVYYFIAHENLPQLWRSDGTQAGTWQLRDAIPGLGGYPSQLMVTDAAIYFISFGWEWWRTDGTAEGTFEMTGVPTPRKWLAVGDRLFFTTQAGGGASMVALWVTDGTIAGSHLVTNSYLNSGDSPSDPRLKAAAVGETLYFLGPDTAPVLSSLALWSTGGTPETTARVTNLGLSHVDASDLTAVGGQLYVKTTNEFFESDGTAAGTKSLFSPGPLIAFPNTLRSSLAWRDGLLYFSYESYNVGFEPHTYQNVPATVIGRHLFYNQSKFDGSTLGLDDADDGAIATDKAPYIAGSGLATFENVSSYHRGINGVMIDFAGLPPAASPAILTPADFVFRIGSTNDLSTWTTAPAPVEFALRFPTGKSSELTRASFRWDHFAIQNTWLEITVLANERTGLERPDVFYFGNRIGDTGSGTAANFTTSIADVLMARSNVGPNQSITSVLDFTRDRLVTAVDELVARNNTGSLRKLDLPATGVPPTGIPAAAIPAPGITTPLVALFEQDDTLEPLAGPMAEEGTASRKIEPFTESELARQYLLAYAMQSWQEWLGREEDEELVTGLRLPMWPRR